MSKKKYLKVRGFVVSDSTGKPVPGIQLQLRVVKGIRMATVPDGYNNNEEETKEDKTGLVNLSELTLAVLTSDAKGYFSFDISSIELDTVMKIWVEGTGASSLEIFDIKKRIYLIPYLSSKQPPVFTIKVSKNAPVYTCGYQSIQNPDHIDWEISPKSFVTSPVNGDCSCPGTDDCAPFRNSTYAVREYFFQELGNIDTEKGEDDEAFPNRTESGHFMTGELHEYRQSWVPAGHALGEILYSLTLAPCESVNLAVIDWSREDNASRMEGIEYGENLDHNLHHDRTIDEIVKGALEEKQSGGSFLGGISASYNGATLSIGGSLSSSRGSRVVTGNSVQRIADSVVQNSNVQRRLRSTVIVQATQKEKDRVETRTVTNHNHCHALTVQYYEVLRHFRVITEYISTTNVLLVPFPLAVFTEEMALQYRTQLQPALLDLLMSRGFEALLRKKFGKKIITAPVETVPAAVDYAEEKVARLTISVTLGDEGLLGDGSDVKFYYKLGDDKEKVFDLFRNDDFEEGQTYQHTVELLPTNVLSSFMNLDSEMLAKFKASLPKVKDFHAFGIRNMTSVDDWSLAHIKIGWKSETAEGIFYDSAIEPEEIFFSDSANKLEKTFSGVNSVWEVTRGAKKTTPEVKKEQGKEESDPSPMDDQIMIDVLLSHLQANKFYYSKVLWLTQDPDERAALFRRMTYKGKKLIGLVENNIVAIQGNHLVFPLKNQEVTGNYSFDTEVRMLALPTRGAFAETMLSNCNACEKKDNTRYWEWENDNDAPAITGVSPGTRNKLPDLSTSTLPAGIQITNVPSVPDPAGLKEVISLLGKADVFRSMTGLKEVQILLDGLTKGSIDLAKAKDLAKKIKEKTSDESSEKDNKENDTDITEVSVDEVPGDEVPPPEEPGMDDVPALPAGPDNENDDDEEEDDDDDLPDMVPLSPPLPVAGISVSFAQKQVDWDKVVGNRNLNLLFGIAKATEGVKADNQFARNWQEMNRVGLVRGAYHFFTVKDKEYVEEQAEKFIATVKAQGGFTKNDLPPIIDIQEADAKKDAQGNTTYGSGINPTLLKHPDGSVHEPNRQEILDGIKVWLEKVHKAFGAKPMIYTNRRTWLLLGNPSQFSSYYLWVEDQWNQKPVLFGGWKKWDLWKYSIKVHVDGAGDARGEVATSVFNGTEPAMQQWLQHNVWSK